MPSLATLTAVAQTVPFAPPALGPEEIAEVVAVLESGWLSTGPRVRRFEQAFARYVGAPYAIAVNSCTAALHLSLLASGVGQGDEVVTSPLTFCATANVVVHCGATPVFADVDGRTGNLDTRAAEAAVTSRTRAVIPVHYAGRPADVRGLNALAEQHGVTLVEDAAHCVEGIADGRRIGTTAHFSCFSFYATKNLTTGEGGMVTTSDEKAADYIRVASLHGMDKDAWARYSPGHSGQYDVVMPGFKYNMTDIQAAMGIHQLARLDARHARRTAIWDAYDTGLAGLPVTRPLPAEAGTVHARHIYSVLVNEDEAGITRDELQARLRERGIATSVHFRALHLHPYYRDRYGLRRGMFPMAESISDRTLSLPLSAAMTGSAVDRVIEAMHEALG